MIATALLALTLWHGWVPATAKHGSLRTADDVRIAYANDEHLLVLPGINGLLAHHL